MDLTMLFLIGLTMLSAVAVTALIMSNANGSKLKRQYGSLEHLKALVDEEERQLKGLRDRREEYGRAIKFLEDNPELESEREKLLGMIASNEKTLSELNAKRDALKEEAMQLETVVSTIKELESESEKLTANNKKATAEQENLRSENNRLNEANAGLLAEQKQVQMDVATKESRYKELSDRISDLQDSLKEQERKLDIDVKASTELEHDLAMAQIEKDSLNKDIATLTANRKDLAASNATLTSENANLEKAKMALTGEVSSLESRRSLAEKWLNDNAGKLVHLEDLERKILQRKEELDALEKRIETAHKSLDDTLKTIEKGIERLTNMNLSGVQTLRLSSFDGLKNGEGAFRLPARDDCKEPFVKEDEGKALAAVAEHFKDKGFEVPQRLLYAFHTSLKTSDMSSLTVMAGVSGTGKSAIPKLYAEEMGIFFSPLAVEPRWDSPKDLMGFFNYVTNRYEPTPLARAMFQFQGLWDVDFKPDCELDQYMFMPMLDEMNLARIEYYFSEFLSKLEMRRLVGELKSENIASVALEVFPGFKGVVEGKSVHEKPVMIFANTNTLFVGTMNEDETTQSLSDKVIDRANVLFFGKPKELRPMASSMNAGNAAKGRFPLKRETWMSWCREVNEGALTGPIEVLTALNDQLAEFNRPFAHRTFQAMLAYMANYPAMEGVDDDQRIRQALADQIGMRIMPKLRGVELNQNRRTLEEIRGILSDRARLNDPLLLAAFENAINTDKGSGFFRWNGFDW